MRYNNDTAEREAAVHEIRQWVRLARVCNNRCLFCLDSPAQDGSLVPEHEVLAKIVEGRRRGAQRLILSGGEPTIHPKYLDFVAFGSGLGYSWIQTITNGRMFCYPHFAKQAVRSGLSEATFSLHGHNAEIHDRLVGHPGAFAQAVAGLKRLLDLGVVVSVDVVLNKINLPFLSEIVQFYVSLGVHEFDLLFIVPFGRGWDENRDLLFPEPELLQKEMDRCLASLDMTKVVVWTNRLPIQYLEGREWLFQDPHKIYDEVLGEREAFRLLFTEGQQPDCLGERCAFCFLRPFCEAARRYKAGLWEAAEEVSSLQWTKDLVAQVLNGLRIEGANVCFPTRETLSEARLVTPTVSDHFRALRLADIKIHGLPPCLGGPGPGPWDWPAPESEVFRPDGSLDLERFVSFFIRKLYRVKSMRCRSCKYDPLCQGLHVNVARIWGLRVLRPFDGK